MTSCIASALFCERDWYVLDLDALPERVYLPCTNSYILIVGYSNPDNNLKIYILRILHECPCSIRFIKRVGKILNAIFLSNVM